MVTTRLEAGEAIRQAMLLAPEVSSSRILLGDAYRSILGDIRPKAATIAHTLAQARDRISGPAGETLELRAAIDKAITAVREWGSRKKGAWPPDVPPKNPTPTDYVV